MKTVLQQLKEYNARHNPNRKGPKTMTAVNSNAAPINLNLYDDVEITPMRKYADLEQEWHAPLDACDEGYKPDYYTVHGHLKTGGVEDLIDCVDERSANNAAYLLRLVLGAQL